MNRRTKKILTNVFIGVAGVLFLLGGVVYVGLSESTPTQIEESATNETEEQSYHLNDTVTNDVIEFTALSTEKLKTVSENNDGYEYTVAEAEGSNIYYAVKVHIKNVSNESIFLDDTGFKLIIGDNVYSAASDVFADDSLFLTEINPGTSKESTLYFTIDESTDTSNAILDIQESLFNDTGDIQIVLTDK